MFIVVGFVISFLKSLEAHFSAETTLQCNRALLMCVVRVTVTIRCETLRFVRRGLQLRNPTLYRYNWHINRETHTLTDTHTHTPRLSAIHSEVRAYGSPCRSTTSH